ncbi:unnamed protein product, partial [Rotaria magnacalcarata]
NHQPSFDDIVSNESMTVDGQRRQRRRQNLKTSFYQQNEMVNILIFIRCTNKYNVDHKP